MGGNSQDLSFNFLRCEFRLTSLPSSKREKKKSWKGIELLTSEAQTTSQLTTSAAISLIYLGKLDKYF